MTHSNSDNRSPTPSQAPFSLKWVTTNLGVKPLFAQNYLDQSDHHPGFSTFSTDSRATPEGALFVAIKGDHLDGHQFIASALKRGATGLLIDEGFAFPNEVTSILDPSVAIFRVPDTLTSFRHLAHVWRSCFHLPVLALAGANGKTTTKELLAAILMGRFTCVLKTEGSQNGYLGIALTLIRLRSSDQIAVVEIGIDEVGAMDQHMTMVAPTRALVTLIAPEHLEKLKDIETVAREENLALLRCSQNGGIVIVNRDDPRIDEHWLSFPDERRWGYSLSRPLPPGPHNLCGRYQPSAFTLSVSGGDWSSEVFPLPLPGKHNAVNLLAAIAMARSLGLSAEEIRDGLKTFRGAVGRSEIRRLPMGARVICDYYNSSPASLQAALELLQQEVQASPGSQPIAVLGDMLELGSSELDYHRGIAPFLISVRAAPVLLYGPRMRALHEELRRIQPDFQCLHFDSHAQLAAELRKHLRPESILLIKGSRGMKMEGVWELLSRAEILSPHPDSLARASQLLQSGELVGLPTETVYGLAGNGLDPDALSKIFATKERPHFDPLILHIAPALPGPPGSAEESNAPFEQLLKSDLVDFGQISPLARERIERLVNRFWPGPLTLVLPKRPRVPDLATSGLPTVAVRMPAHATAQQLIRMAGFPLAAPSANRFGRISPTCALDVVAELGSRIPAVIDGGQCQIGVESTILAVKPSGELLQLRPGILSTQELEEAAGIGRGSVEVNSSPSSQTETTPATLPPPNSGLDGKAGMPARLGGMSSPGQLPSHYAPTKRLYLIPAGLTQALERGPASPSTKTGPQELARWIQSLIEPHDRVGILWMTQPTDPTLQALKEQLGGALESRCLSQKGNAHEAAQNLFGQLRALDLSSADVLFAQQVPPHFNPDHGLGYAMQDRLKRAAATTGG